MRNAFVFSVPLIALISAPVPADDLAQRAAASREAVNELAGALQGELSAAMKVGGLAAMDCGPDAARGR